MLIKVLGSGAGGGFPQWNCNGAQSRAVRAGRPGFLARSQSSIAVSADGRDWVLFDASPDLRQQIHDNKELHPLIDGPVRNSPIKATIHSSGDVDHIAGLLHLRERQKFTVYATSDVHDVLKANSIFAVLNENCVRREVFGFEGPVSLDGPNGPLGIVIEAFPVPGKIPLYLEKEGVSLEEMMSHKGAAVGFEIRADGRGDELGEGKSGSFFYIPGCANVDDALAKRLAGAELLLFDGTVFTDSELPDQGLMDKTGRRMGHQPLSGGDGSIAALAGRGIRRKILIHINNSNPILDENSSARRCVEEAGWQVAYDGMEISL